MVWPSGLVIGIAANPTTYPSSTIGWFINAGWVRASSVITAAPVVTIGLEIERCKGIWRRAAISWGSPIALGTYIVS